MRALAESAPIPRGQEKVIFGAQTRKAWSEVVPDEECRDIPDWEAIGTYYRAASRSWCDISTTPPFRNTAATRCRTRATGIGCVGACGPQPSWKRCKSGLTWAPLTCVHILCDGGGIRWCQGGFCSACRVWLR